jgi:hypothetical protein
MNLTKLEVEEHQASLRTGSGERFGIALLALMENDYERVKNQMVDASSEEVWGLQGEARAFRRVLKYLKDRPVATTKV